MPRSFVPLRLRVLLCDDGDLLLLLLLALPVRYCTKRTGSILASLMAMPNMLLLLPLVELESPSRSSDSSSRDLRGGRLAYAEEEEECKTVVEKEKPEELVVLSFL